MTRRRPRARLLSPEGRELLACLTVVLGCALAAAITLTH